MSPIRHTTPGDFLTSISENEDRKICSELKKFPPKPLCLRVVSENTIGLKIDFGGKIIFMTSIRENGDRPISNNSGLFSLNFYGFGWSP